MVRWFRQLVLWLVVVTIPMQGIAAAAAMQLCVPPQASASAAPVRAGADRPALHGHVAAPGAHSVHNMAHPHGHTKAADTLDLPAVEPGADNTGQTGHSTLKCCSAGCSMAVFMAPHLVAYLPAHAGAPALPNALIFQGVVLDGLERPPRLLRA